MKRKQSIEGRIALTLISYTIFIVALLWLFQILFLNNYYHIMKKSSVMRAGNEIATKISAQDFGDQLERICFQHGMCCVIFDSNGREVYSIDMLGRGCLIHSPTRTSMAKMLKPVFIGEKSEEIFYMRHSHFRTEAFIYAKAAVNSNGERFMIVMNAQLSPVESSKQILKSQLKIITAILIIMALLISKFVANRLSKPIRGITDKAKRLANGNYIADYSGGNIAEIDELAETLNFSAKELSKVEELRRELIANVSHDLKTPLTMIKAYAEMIRDLTGDVKQSRDEQLEVIISESDRLTALVTDLIKISREQNDMQNYTPQSFNIKAMIEDITARFAATNGDYTINLNFTSSEMAYADAEKIGQVLYNLISNAINYTGEDKTVNIELYKTDKNMLHINIKDSGKGIPAEELPLIWERYYRSKNTHQRPIVGTGLGLSIVKGALVGQNLPFGVNSEPEKGSCFWFELPTAK